VTVFARLARAALHAYDRYRAEADLHLPAPYTRAARAGPDPIPAEFFAQIFVKSRI